MKELELIRRQLEAWGIRLDSGSFEALLKYAVQLRDYREANVVGTRDLSKLLLDHVLDSLSCLLCKPLWDARKLVDVGSGGGLPGIPLKISRPELALTLVEATGKKARFLSEVVEHLPLARTEVLNVRAETLGHEPKSRGESDVVTARAVAPLSTISEYCLPLIRKGGSLVAMKALLDKQEIEEGKRAAEVLGAKVTEFIEVDFLPELPAKKRLLVVVEKHSDTPDDYPRRIGLPKKSPLGRR